MARRLELYKVYGTPLTFTRKHKPISLSVTVVQYLQKTLRTTLHTDCTISSKLTTLINVWNLDFTKQKCG